MKKKKNKHNDGMLTVVLLALVSTLGGFFIRVLRYGVVWSIIRNCFWPVIIFLAVTLLIAGIVLTIGGKKK